MKQSRRESALIKSIQSALTREKESKKTILKKFLAFFSVRRTKLSRHERELFDKLRLEIWNFDQTEYQASFHTRGQLPLKTVGDLGYSGSVSD